MSLRGAVVVAPGKLHKENPCRDSFLKDLFRKSVEIRTTGKYFDSWLTPFSTILPCVSASSAPPLPCLSPTLLSVSPSFPLSLSTSCHCQLLQCECASPLPCVVTQDRLFTSRGVRRMWVCFTLPLDFNQD